VDNLASRPADDQVTRAGAEPDLLDGQSRVVRERVKAANLQQKKKGQKTPIMTNCTQKTWKMNEILNTSSHITLSQPSLSRHHFQIQNIEELKKLSLQGSLQKRAFKGGGY
jgi:hypothetical protein